jgi:UDPglucose 6-dehydrogenase
MKIAIIGQDTLAAAAIACCKRHFEVVTSVEADIDLLWICYDTPIGPGGEPDIGWVHDRIRSTLVLLGNLPHRFPVILLSSQMPVGTLQALENYYPGHTWAVSPENIRVATAVTDFENQARIVVGTRGSTRHEVLETVLSKFTSNIIWTDPESAEMVKHALNCFLGLQIAFINEIARICMQVGADPLVVSQGLKTDQRVSPKAPLRPGAPFGGGHLARDIYLMSHLGLRVPIIEAITPSNES